MVDNIGFKLILEGLIVNYTMGILTFCSGMLFSDGIVPVMNSIFRVISIIAIVVIIYGIGRVSQISEDLRHTKNIYIFQIVFDCFANILTTIMVVIDGFMTEHRMLSVGSVFGYFIIRECILNYMEIKGLVNGINEYLTNLGDKECTMKNNSAFHLVKRSLLWLLIGLVMFLGLIITCIIFQTTISEMGWLAVIVLLVSLVTIFISIIANTIARFFLIKNFGKSYQVIKELGE